MKAVRLLILFVLILANLGSALLTPLIYLDFSLRRDYIATVLCIKKDKPITVCGGNCYLNRQLDKAHQQQEKEEKTTAKEYIFFYDSIASIDTAASNYNLIDDQKHSYKPTYNSRISFDIFHPPRIG